MFNENSLKHIILVSLILGLASCSGGGGGDGGGSSEDGPRRSTHTGIRILHGGVNGSPVDVWIGTVLVQSARYAEVKYYAEVSPGPTTIRIERANSPGVVLGQVEANLAENTEYSLYIAGVKTSGQLSVALREDTTKRPENGSAKLQLLNAVQGGGELTLEIEGQGGQVFSGIGAGHSSSFATVPSGARVIKVHNASRSYEENLSYEIPDKGEVTLMVTGSESLGVRFTRFYADLD